MKLTTLLLMLCSTCLALLSFGGCGGSGDSASTDSLSKAQFVAQGDAICKRVQKEIAQKESAYLAEHGSASSKADIEKLLMTIVVPALKTQTTGLAKLGTPQADGGEAASVVKSFEEAVRKAESAPGVIANFETSPLVKAGRLAKAYGFRECGVYGA